MDELSLNIKSFWNSAELVFNSRDYTSATILYFKCLFAVLDLIIFKNKGITPKDHNERFRILQANFSEAYLILDKIFPIYRNTYSINISRIKCEEARKYVQQIAEKYKIELSSK